MTYKHEMKGTARIVVSGEVGIVIARCEYLNSEAMYLLRYEDKMGRAQECWWGESALEQA